MNQMEKTTRILNSKTYHLHVYRNQVLPAEHPRLIIPTFLPNRTALEMLVICLQSIQNFTQFPHEVWISDNNSPSQYSAWLTEQPGINIILNKTTPIPPNKHQIWNLFSRKKQYRWGSYANAVGLEIALQFIPQETKNILTLHMDTLACHHNWLSFLTSKLGERVKAAGFRLERHRNPEGVLHVLGCLFDYQLFKELNLDFFPQLPQIDVGDKITLAFRKAGYQIYACADKQEQIDSIKRMPSYFQNVNVDRFLDDQDNLIFLHLGRGVRKSIGKHLSGISSTDWIKMAKVSGFANGL
jgi:hypothetical protein